MCKSWAITYRCAHIDVFRLSRCRGTVSTSKGTVAACMSYPALGFRSYKMCGPCQLDASTAALKTQCLIQYWATPEHQQEELKRELENALWRLERKVPRERPKYVPRLKTRIFVPNQRSPLANELRGEDIEDQDLDEGWSREETRIHEWYDFEMESAADYSASFDKATTKGDSFGAEKHDAVAETLELRENIKPSNSLSVAVILVQSGQGVDAARRK